MALLADDLAEYLEPGESVLWSERPPRGIMLHSVDIIMLPFGFLYLGGALFMLAISMGAFGRKPFVLFALLCLPFVAAGLYWAIGRFPWDALVRGGTLYALTNRRAIILRSWPSLCVRSLPLTSATEISIDQGVQDTGTIYFGPRVTMNNLTYRRSWCDEDPEFKFQYIAGLGEALRVVAGVQRQT